MPPMKYWEIVADKLAAAGWSWGIVAPSHRMAGVGLLTHIAKVYVVESDELPSAFLELEATLLCVPVWQVSHRFASQ